MIRCVSLLLLCAATSAWGQDNLQTLKAAFFQGRDENLLQRLVAYHDSIPENSSFEVDYMIAATLAELPAFQSSACDYAHSLSVYQQPVRFNNQTIDLNAFDQRICPPPPPTGPGVYTVFSAKIPNKAAILKNIRSQLSVRRAIGGRAGMVPPKLPPSPTDGTYSMVYDGWKAELTLTAGGGVLLGSDGIRRSVKVVTKPGYHIVFYVGGLGGENADGQGGQKFEGYQMTQTHDAIAGLTWWQGQTFGFYAIKH